MNHEPSTLIDLLEMHARLIPEKPAFYWQGEAHSFAALWERVNRFAASLLEQGLQRGKRVVLVLPNGSEFFHAFYGVQRAGGIAVPVFPGSGAERILSIAERCGAKLIVAPAADHANWQARFDALPKAIPVISADSQADRPTATFPAIQANGIAYIQYTSGSTGLPKGIPLSHANLLTNARMLIEAMAITDQDVFVSWLPVYHDMGLILMTIVPFVLGAALHLLPTSLSNPQVWLDRLQTQRGTFTAAPDFAYRLCLRFIRDPETYDLSSLRVALNAAEPVRPSTIREFETAFGMHNVMVAGYGLAEATVGVATWHPGAAPLIDERGLVSVGTPFRGIDIQIVANDQPLERGVVGEIMISSPTNTRGYYEEPDDKSLFWHEDYIRTGDLGYLDNTGNLFIAGRTKNIIKHGGQTIFPQEVEAIVERLDGVRRAAAAGIDRGDVAGEQLYIFAEVRKPSSLSEDDCYHLMVELVEAVYDQIGIRPARVCLLKPHAIPQTYNGKTQYNTLKQSYLSGDLRRAGLMLAPAD